MPGPAGTRREETKLSSSNARTIAFAGRQVPVVVVLGVAALLAAWLGIVYFAEPWGATLLPSGMDARCYWAPGLSDPYLHSSWTDQIAYTYSPAFLQMLQPTSTTAMACLHGPVGRDSDGRAGLPDWSAADLCWASPSSV